MYGVIVKDCVRAIVLRLGDMFGAVVSIHCRVTVIFTVLDSLSLSWIVQVSVPCCHVNGVYVMLFHAMLQDHFVQFETIELYTISVLPQDHSAALDKVFQSAVLAVFHTFALPTKLLAVGFTLLNVYVAVDED